MSTPSKTSLGNLEFLVLLAILRLGDNAYPVPIARELDRCGNKALSRAAIHVTLQRLEDHELVESTLAAPRDESAGRARRYYKVLPEGVALVRQSKAIYSRLWKGLDVLRESSR